MFMLFWTGGKNIMKKGEKEIGGKGNKGSVIRLKFRSVWVVSVSSEISEMCKRMSFNGFEKRFYLLS